MKPVIFCTPEEFRSHRRLIPGPGDPNAAVKIIEQDGPRVAISRSSFIWECPGCGYAMGGTIGAVAVSGWENPVWVLSGTKDKPTLHPSLGCSRWKAGKCQHGHFFLKEGELVDA